MFWLFSLRSGALSRLAANPFLSALRAPSGAAVAALATFSRT
ncbi:hypothetical protein [Hansschlegelia plantiphila]|nr:hypothetical protein [Hansschlegelia plantiphila]